MSRRFSSDSENMKVSSAAVSALEFLQGGVARTAKATLKLFGINNQPTEA